LKRFKNPRYYDGLDRQSTKPVGNLWETVFIIFKYNHLQGLIGTAYIIGNNPPGLPCFSG